MKQLTTYFECDTTPGGVPGAGNPAPPVGNEPGSGDLLTTKLPRKKKRKVQEGILDTDFGDDSFDGNFLDQFLDQYCDYYTRKIDPTESEYTKLYNNLKEVCASISKKYPNMSLMKAYRSKDVTMFTFKEKTGCGSTAVTCKNGIEIRKFVKNPLPYSIEMAWNSDFNAIRITSNKKTNHPSNIHMSLWRSFILPPEIFDQVMKRLGDRGMHIF